MSARVLDCTMEEYHRDPCATPSLSSSMAHVLISQSPAHAYRSHPRLGGTDRAVNRAALPLRRGNAFHSLLFGGPTVHELDAPDWRKLAIREERDALLDAGEIPMLAHELAEVRAQLQAAQQELAQAGIELAGSSELAIEWTDGDVVCRSMLDHVMMRGGDAWIIDAKTTHDVHPDKFSLSVYNHGYDIQCHAYRQAIRALWPDVNQVVFLWLVIEATAPYGSYLVPPGGTAEMLGEKRWESAVELWERCIRTNSWPGYQPGFINPPAWAMSRWLEKEVEIYDAG